jgi:hypothetical protein
LNVLIPVLPLHGPRKTGRRSGDGLFSTEVLDMVHAVAQALWDTRRLLGWLREHADAPVGVYGVSLGAYLTALLAAFDPNLACAIALMPTVCLASLMRLHTPQRLVAAPAREGFSWDAMERVLQVVSPLAVRPQVDRSRRFLIGAAADRLVPEDHLATLWRHWDEPFLEWLPGTHLSFSWQGRSVRRVLGPILVSTGLAHDGLTAAARDAA